MAKISPIWRGNCTAFHLEQIVEVQMHSGQTRAVLMREGRAGKATEVLLREKRMGDLAWQMNVTQQKISACPREKRTAKESLQKLYSEAKAEYDRLNFEIDVENAPKDYGVYLG